jgi:hypothetical protein
MKKVILGSRKRTKSKSFFTRKSVVSFISGAYFVDNKKMNVHIIDSNTESDEEMSNTTAKVMSKCLMRRGAFYANFRILHVTPLRYTYFSSAVHGYYNT